MRARVPGRRMPSSEWVRWFAWHPIVIDDELVWLETVMRRWESFEGWQYRVLEDGMIP